MQIIHLLLWGVVTPGKLGSSSSQAFMFSFLICSSKFFFLLTEFYYTFSMSYKILAYYFYLIFSPQGVVTSGWTIGVDSYEIHPLCQALQPRVAMYSLSYNLPPITPFANPCLIFFNVSTKQSHKIHSVVKRVLRGLNYWLVNYQKAYLYVAYRIKY